MKRSILSVLFALILVIFTAPAVNAQVLGSHIGYEQYRSMNCGGCAPIDYGYSYGDPYGYSYPTSYDYVPYNYGYSNYGYSNYGYGTTYGYNNYGYSPLVDIAMMALGGNNYYGYDNYYGYNQYDDYYGYGYGYDDYGYGYGDYYGW